MKKMRILFSLLLALALVCSLGVTAFAADGDPVETGTITINNAVPMQTYSIYKLFDLESYDLGEPGITEDDHFVYTISETSPWYAFVTTGAGKNYIDLVPHSDEGLHYVSWKNSAGTATGAAFAVEAIAYAKGNNIQPLQSISNEYNTTVVFAGADTNGDGRPDGLPLGYYLVDSTVGALCALTTTQPDAVIQAKNTAPTIDKGVKDDSMPDYADRNDSYIGETVYFKTTIDLGHGSENLVLHDQMSAGLTLDKNSIKVYKSGTLIAAGPDTYSVHFDVNHGTTENPEICTFEINVASKYAAQLLETDELTVTYSAVVNENAVIAGAGNPNDTWLDYGDGHSTEKDTTVTYVWEFDIYKFTNDNSGTQAVRVPLEGAVFTVSSNGKDVNIPFVLVSSEPYPVYRVATIAEQLDENVKIYTELTTDETGRIKLIGLDVGEFVITEIEAPPGYNQLAVPVVIIIKNDGTINPVDGTPTKGKVIEILNNAGSLLPQTGGMGTTLFYVLGGILVLAAVVLLVTKRRMGARN